MIFHYTEKNVIIETKKNADLFAKHMEETYSEKLYSAD